MQDKKKCSKKDNTCPKDNVKKQLNDLEEISRSRSRRCFFATCEDEKVKSICQWLHKVFYEKINIDTKTRKQLPATLSNKDVKKVIRLLTPSENDISFKCPLCAHSTT